MSDPDRTDPKPPRRENSNVNKRATLRELFLRTGRPLEEEIAKTLPLLPAADFGSYSFRRSDEGRPESVDRHATMKIDIGNQSQLNVHFFIECKYSPKAKWIFYEAPSSIVHEASNITLGPEKLREVVAKMPFLNAPNVHGGDVFFEHPGGGWQNVPDVMSDALRQCSLAALDAYAAHLTSGAAFGGGGDLDVYVPVLVTSAEMLRIRSKTTLTDIEMDETSFQKALLPTPYANHFTAPPIHLQEAFLVFLDRHLNAVIGTGEHVDEELQRYGSTTEQVVHNLWSQHVNGIPGRALMFHIAEAENALGATFNTFRNVLAKHGHEGHWT